MANGLLSQIANPDVTTPLLQGVGIARQRQQDVQAQQQQEVVNQARQQQVAFQQQQFQAQQAQVQFDNELDLIDKANEAGFTNQRNIKLAPLLGVTVEELNAVDEASQKKISNAIRQAKKVFSDNKVGVQDTNKQIGVIGQLLKDELGIGQTQQPPTPQPQVAQQPQPQATPQDNISQARQGIAQLQSITPRNAQEKAQLEATVNQLEGFITDEERKLPKTSVGNREETKINFATEVAQSKLDTKLAKEGKPSREVTPEEAGAEYEDIYGESVSESLLKAGGRSDIKLEETEFIDFGKQVTESDKNIRKNIRSVGVINAGLAQLEKGIISGAFANAELSFKKALSKLNLVNPETKEKITNTESYAGFMGIRTGEVIRLFGAGTGLSDEDRKFANRISAGDITLDAPSLARLQKMNKQLLLEEAILHNELVDDLNIARDDRGKKPSIRKKVDINKFLTKGNGKQIDEDNAKLFFAATRGDRSKAREMALANGWKF